MKRNALVGIVAAIGAIVVIAPLGYAFAQRAAIASLDFDFNRFELTDIDFSETQTFGSMQRIVANSESPSLNMLQDFYSIQSSIATPQSFALDLISNTRLTYSMFVDVHNPSSFEAVIDRAQVIVSINGQNLADPVSIDQQYQIAPGQTQEVELRGISVNGKEIAGLLYNLASDDFILTIDFAITSYFPTLLGEVSVPANVNVQMYLISPKPQYLNFESSYTSVQQVSYQPGSSDYKLSFANQNEVPISGKFEVGVLKGNLLSNIGLCDPACIAPVDNGFATFMRIKGSSVFDIQVIESENLRLNSGDSHTLDITNPVLRSNANSAFIIRWVPDYEKIPYILKSSLAGIERSSSSEFESPSFAIVRNIAYNIINDFGYVGSQEFISPDKSTFLTIEASDYFVEEGDRIVFSGKLTDSFGRGVPNKHIEIRENDSADEDESLTSATTDNLGEFDVSWNVQDTDFWNDVLDIFATFDGDLHYEESRSEEIGIEITSSSSEEPTTSTQPSQEYSDIAFDVSEYLVYEGDSILFSGQLTDSSGNGIGGATIYLKDEDSFDFDDDIGYLQTDNDGMFAGTWQAERLDSDNAIEVYAVFEGSPEFVGSRSSEIEIEILEYQEQEQQAPPSPQEQQYQNAAMTIDVSSQVVDEGDTVTISGQLTDENGDGVTNALIYLKDEDTGSGDDILETIITDSNGDYFFSWQATQSDPFDNVVEIYTVFEGSQNYSQARSIQVNVTIT